ncbi:MAG: helix-turn-helix domain-containing protein [Planctomycetes bacterium]|nr:helix-turn-helix domain-containing protein [Planctomycetota bacterium]
MQKPDKPAPAFLTADELAALLKVHPATVREQAAAGRIPGAFRMGRLWRFDLDAFRAAGGLQPGTPAPRLGRAKDGIDIRALMDSVIAGEMGEGRRPRWRG